MLVPWAVEPFPAPSWLPAFLALLSVGYLKDAGQEGFPLIATDSLGRGWPDSSSWDEGEVGGTWLPGGGGGSWLGLRVDAIPCR